MFDSSKIFLYHNNNSFIANTISSKQNCMTFLVWHQHLHFINIPVFLSPVTHRDQFRYSFFLYQIVDFHAIFSNLHLAPLPASVYKRSPDDGGQRCLVGLARSSPSNLRLAPSLHVSSSTPPLFIIPFAKYVARSSGEFQVSGRRDSTSSNQTWK